MQTLSQGTINRLTDSSKLQYSIVTEADDVYPKMMDELWQVVLYQKAINLKQTADSKQGFIASLSKNGITDFHWKWESIVNSPNIQEYEKKTFYFIIENRPQGVLHALFPKQSRLDQGDNLVYVDRIAVAPWNRSSATPQEFKGVGSLLMVFIKQFSDKQGFGGAVGLHALEQARTFYVYLGMESLGMDQSYEGLEYFELPKKIPLGSKAAEESI